MNTQPTQELESLLEDLSAIVDSYDPKSEYILAAAILSFIAICLIILYAVGVLLGLLLLGVAFFPILYKTLPYIKNHPSEKELSRRACALMASCINIYKYPGNDPLSISSKMILTYSHDGNLPLYQEFISFFPYMASKKLKKLASIKIGFEN